MAPYSKLSYLATLLPSGTPVCSLTISLSGGSAWTCRPREDPGGPQGPFIIPAQPVAYPSGGSHEVGSSLAYTPFAHIGHMHREHSRSHHEIFLFPECLFESSPLCFIYVVSENEAIYKVFGLVCFSWNGLWRVAIPWAMNS